VKKIELEKWVFKERENIKKTQQEIEKSYQRAMDTIIRTKRDLEFMNKMDGS